MAKLGKKPSTFLRQALDDLAAVERDKKTYAIDMHDWHAPASSLQKKCEVCFAGSVMAKRLGVHPEEHADYSDARFTPDVQDRLSALNDFRTGHIQCGLQTIDYEHKPGARYLPQQMKVPDYDVDRLGWKRAMRKMVRMFEDAGI